MIRFSALRPVRTSRARIAAALLCGVLALAGCGDSTGPLPQQGTPDELEFSFGGYGGTGRDVELRGDTVVTHVLHWTWDGNPPKIDTVRVVPDAQAWAGFWDAAARTGVAQWRRTYRAEHIADGVGWGLRLVADGRVVQSHGSNAYPDRNGREHEGEMTDEFRGMMAAVAQLTGVPF